MSAATPTTMSPRRIGSGYRRRGLSSERAGSGEAAGNRMLSVAPFARVRCGRVGLCRLERGHHRLGRGEAVLGPLGHRARHDRVQARRDVRPPLAHARHRLAHVLHGDGHEVLAGVGRLAGQKLVEDGRQRVLVGALVHTLPARLLGSDVLARAEKRSGLGEAVGGIERASDAEIRHLGDAVLVDEDVVRLHVSMDDAVLVRECEAPRDLVHEGDGLVDRQGALPLAERLQGLSVDVLEDDELPALELAPVDHGDDVRVIQLRERSRLTLEALDVLRVVREVLVQDLDCDRALEHAIARSVDARHPTAAGEILKLVATR